MSFGALNVSVELQPYQPHPKDNAMKSETEINRFFMGDKSTIGLNSVILATNVWILAEMCWCAGPQLWRLCSFVHPEFARLFHLGSYKGSKFETPMALTKCRMAVRKIFTDFYRRWARLGTVTTGGGGTLWVTSYENQRGQLMNPLHPCGRPAFSCRSESVPNEFIEQWFDGKGGLSRWVTDSKGECVDRKFGYPCSVISRSVIADTWFEFDDAVNDFVTVNEYGTQITLKYQTVSGFYRTVVVEPDSESEFENFVTCGCHASHPLVRRFCPNVLSLLESESEP